ncbi:MAG TPA: PIN domain-containing protein [Solirubrobacterales bacterium]|nr:PIN domain-containing protein [Solirubrobacterales bacterium]
MAVVLDSDAVIGFLDRGDALHDAAAAAVRECAHRQPLVASVVTYAEVLTGARMGHHDEDHVEEFFAKLISELLPVDAAVADRAARLRAGAQGLRMPDALILASADLGPEVDEVLTGDVRAAKLPELECEIRLLR